MSTRDEAEALVGRAVGSLAKLKLPDGTKIPVMVTKATVDVEPVDVTTERYWAEHRARHVVDGLVSITFEVTMTGAPK